LVSQYQHLSLSGGLHQLGWGAQGRFFWIEQPLQGLHLASPTHKEDHPSRR
jgi:hypothetical protein